MTSTWAVETDTTHQPGEERPPAGLPDAARRAFVSALTQRYLTRTRHRAVWDALLTYEQEIRQRLDEMYLDLVLDVELEVAFTRQQDGEDIPRVLRRDKPLSRDASLLLHFLRLEYDLVDVGEPVVVSRTQIEEFLRTFRQQGDTDGARFDRRVDAAINTLTTPLGLLQPDPEADYLFTVSPVIVPLIGVDETQRLEAAYRAATSTDSDDTDSEDTTAGTDPEPETEGTTP